MPTTILNSNSDIGASGCLSCLSIVQTEIKKRDYALTTMKMLS